jgi:hypothetical protein
MNAHQPSSVTRMEGLATSNVAAVLGAELCARVDDVVLGLGTLTPTVPNTSRWAYASSIEGTLAGLRKERGGPEPRDWTVAAGRDTAGTPQVIATNLLRAVPHDRRAQIAALFDLHPRIRHGRCYIDGEPKSWPPVPPEHWPSGN